MPQIFVTKTEKTIVPAATVYFINGTKRSPFILHSKAILWHECRKQNRKTNISEDFRARFRLFFSLPGRRRRQRCRFVMGIRLDMAAHMENVWHNGKTVLFTHDALLSLYFYHFPFHSRRRHNACTIHFASNNVAPVQHEYMPLGNMSLLLLPRYRWVACATKTTILAWVVPNVLSLSNRL